MSSPQYHNKAERKRKQQQPQDFFYDQELPAKMLKKQENCQLKSLQIDQNTAKKKNKKHSQEQNQKCTLENVHEKLGTHIKLGTGPGMRSGQGPGMKVELGIGIESTASETVVNNDARNHTNLETRKRTTITTDAENAEVARRIMNLSNNSRTPPVMLFPQKLHKLLNDVTAASARNNGAAPSNTKISTRVPPESLKKKSKTKSKGGSLFTVSPPRLNKDAVNIISWSTDGKKFRIHDKARFEKEVMPLYFESSKLRSFQRNLHLWGFIKCPFSRGEGGEWSHDSFRRDDPNLCHTIKRIATKKDAVASRTSQGDILANEVSKIVEENNAGGLPEGTMLLQQTNSTTPRPSMFYETIADFSSDNRSISSSSASLGDNSNDVDYYFHHYKDDQNNIVSKRCDGTSPSVFVGLAGTAASSSALILSASAGKLQDTDNQKLARLKPVPPSFSSKPKTMLSTTTPDHKKTPTMMNTTTRGKHEQQQQNNQYHPMIQPHQSQQTTQVLPSQSNVAQASHERLQELSSNQQADSILKILMLLQAQQQQIGQNFENLLLSSITSNNVVPSSSKLPSRSTMNDSAFDATISSQQQYPTPTSEQMHNITDHATGTTTAVSNPHSAAMVRNTFDGTFTSSESSNNIDDQSKLIQMLLLGILLSSSSPTNENSLTSTNITEENKTKTNTYSYTNTTMINDENDVATISNGDTSFLGKIIDSNGNIPPVLGMAEANNGVMSYGSQGGTTINMLQELPAFFSNPKKMDTKNPFATDTAGNVASRVSIPSQPTKAGFASGSLLDQNSRVTPPQYNNNTQHGSYRLDERKMNASNEQVPTFFQKNNPNPKYVQQYEQYDSYLEEKEDEEVWKLFPTLTAKAVDLLHATQKARAQTNDTNSAIDILYQQYPEKEWTEEMLILSLLGRKSVSLYRQQQQQKKEQQEPKQQINIRKPSPVSFDETSVLNASSTNLQQQKQQQSV